jgi:hypothetical protein
MPVNRDLAKVMRRDAGRALAQHRPRTEPSRRRPPPTADDLDYQEGDEMIYCESCLRFTFVGTVIHAADCADMCAAWTGNPDTIFKFTAQDGAQECR